MYISDMKLIGSGAQADVYLYENKAYKIYKSCHAGDIARYEAKIHGLACKTGLPVPEIYGVTEIEGKISIIMEYISGKPVGEIIQNDKEQTALCLEKAVDTQIKVHKINAAGFPELYEKLKNNIKKTVLLNETQREKLLNILRNMKIDSNLCHGDFHILNLLQTENKIVIIDWIDAASGNKEADVCRSYMLYSLYREDIAEEYLNLYCTKAGIEKNNILTWLPVIAGARLHDNVPEEDKIKLLEMVDS